MGPEFFQTPMGRKFYTSDIPRIASALESIAVNLEKVANPLIKTAIKSESSYTVSVSDEIVKTVRDIEAMSIDDQMKGIFKLLEEHWSNLVSDANYVHNTTCSFRKNADKKIIKDLFAATLTEGFTAKDVSRDVCNISKVVYDILPRSFNMVKKILSGKAILKKEAINEWQNNTTS